MPPAPRTQAISYRPIRVPGRAAWGERVYLERAGRRAADTEGVFSSTQSAKAVCFMSEDCTIHQVGEHDGQPFIAMEWLDGETLQQRLEGGAMATDFHFTTWAVDGSVIGSSVGAESTL